MLFAFPHMNYYDGTFIKKDGTYHRLNNYSLEATKVVEYRNMKFSSEWKLTMNGKNYTLIPKVDGMFNVFFFELLASIRNENNEEVGYCFIELLPGVRNQNKIRDAFVTKKK